MSGNLPRLIKEHFWGLLLLAVLVIASFFVVRGWKKDHPGSMTVLESQAMDMNAMKAPRGSTPVAVETVSSGSFSPSVSYSGTVAPLEEQLVSPRVQGWLTQLKVYDGDRVRAGQLLAVIDSPDLTARVAEASAGHAAAASEVSASRDSADAMASEHSASKAEIEAARRDVTRAKAMAEASRKSVARAEQEVNSARASTEYWRSEIRREENLLKAGAVSKQEYESEKAEAAAAEAELGAKQAMLAEAKADSEAAAAEIASKEAMVSASEAKSRAAASVASGATWETRQKQAMRQQAAATLAGAASVDSYRYIRAPFSGTVTRRYKSPGQLVGPGDGILNIVQIDRVRLQANVSDTDLGRIRVGATVTARFTKYPGITIDAVVTSVSPSADADSRTALVEAIVDNPGQRLVPGDAVTLDIATSSAASAITVPISAVVRKDGRDAVWVVRQETRKGKSVYYCTMHPEVVEPEPGTCPTCLMKLVPKESSTGKRASLVNVRLGRTGGGRVEVISGLCDGDQVIYKGNTYLQEGEQVFPTAWTDDGPSKMPKPPAMESMPGMDHGGHDVDSTPGMEHEGGDMKSMPDMNHSGHDTHSMPGAKPPVVRNPKSAIRNPKSQKTYVCPMHPEVTSHDPKFLCPKCGMKLEEKK